MERNLRDLESNHGGKEVLLGGDPRQTLPDVKTAGRAQTVKLLPLYPLLQEHKLKVNIRTDEAEKEFSNDLLLCVGKAKSNTGSNFSSGFLQATW